ncbi:hypothetical protein CRYUN_Cryun08bG0051900 [Craigia yunnanensis]
MKHADISIHPLITLYLTCSISWPALYFVKFHFKPCPLQIPSPYQRLAMATVRNLKIKTSTCKRIVRELHSYEKEVEREAAKTADMKEKGADPYDLKQQENVLAESRMMIPDCRKRLEGSLADLKGTLVLYINSI